MPDLIKLELTEEEWEAVLSRLSSSSREDNCFYVLFCAATRKLHEQLETETDKIHGRRVSHGNTRLLYWNNISKYSIMETYPLFMEVFHVPS